MKQKDLFLKIWKERRPHVCDLCDGFLGHEPLAYYFSHILSKGAYPRFKLLEKNIMYNCLDCHTKWDQGDPKGLKNFTKISELKQELKQEYYAVN